MLFGLQVCLEYLAHAHCICSGLGCVYWCLDGSTKLELIGLYWYDLQEWDLSHQLLRLLVVKAVGLGVPSGSFKVETLHVGSCLKSLGDLLWISDLGHCGVHC